MNKIAFVFPGQGAQYVGMGKKFYEQYPQAREVYETAAKATGLDLATLCFEDNDQLNQTEYTQIAMFTTEAAILACVKAAGISADLTAGLSLGEYAALLAADVLPLSDLCRLVRKRGMFMQSACPSGGAMMAVLGLESGKIEEICEKITGQVGIANYNCPGQIVITGEDTAVKEAAENCKLAGAKRCIPLKVSGPFHSPMLQKAKDQMKELLDQMSFGTPSIPYYTNVGARKITDQSEIRDLLAHQVVSSVCWQQTMEQMVAEGVDTIIEIGPGKTLCGFMRKIAPSVQCFHVDQPEELQKLMEQFTTGLAGQPVLDPV